MSDKAFFTKLDKKKFSEITDLLISDGTEIVIKLGIQHYKSKILGRKSAATFFIYKFSMLPYNNDSVICSFDVKNEKYFFKSFLSADDAGAELQIPPEIFQLQRRNDFRVAIPLEVSYVCEVMRVNYNRGPFPAQLQDISLGGCQILVPTSLVKFTDNDEVILKLRLNQFENDAIPCFAKRIKKDESNGTTQVGLQFTDTDASFLTELQGTLVYLDRIRRGKGYG